jgi:Methyltransferase domain
LNRPVASAEGKPLAGGTMSELDLIGVVEGTDKSSAVNLSWDYLRHYDELFQKWRHEPINLIEIGVAAGASMRTWLRYFDKATLIGIDTNPVCRNIAGGRVVIEIGSQEDPALIGAIGAKHPPTIVIDDGSHIAHHMIASFEVLFPMLAPGGIYVFEDLAIHFEESPVQWLGAQQHQGLAGMSIYEYLSRFVRARAASVSVPKDTWGFNRYAFEQIDSVVVFGGVIAVRKRAASSNGFDKYVAMFESRLKEGDAPFGMRENYAALLIKQRTNLERAIELLNEEIATHRANLSARSRLTDVFVSAGRFEEAAVHANELVAQKPTEAHYWRQHAYVQRQLKNDDKEFVALQKLVQMDPDAPFTHDALSAIYERRGDIPAALVSARVAAKLAPSNDHFRNRVTSLEARL